MTATVTVERTGAVATLRYDNGPGNLLCISGLIALRRALDEAAADPTVRVVVLAGRRDGFLGPLEPSDGLAMTRAAPRLPWVLHPVVAALAPLAARWLDRLGVLPSSPAWHAHVGYLHHLQLFESLERCRAITVSAIEGHCVAGGLELALCTDLRVVRAVDGLVFALPEVLAGVVPGFGGTQRLARVVGPSVALGLQLTGESLTVEDALRAGLVQHVLPDDGFEPALEALTRSLGRRAPGAVAGIKRAARAAAELPLARGLAAERVEVMRAWSQPAAVDGLARLQALLVQARQDGQADAVSLLEALRADEGAPYRSSTSQLQTT